MTLRPLRCDACGSPAPLAERPAVRCPACGGEVPVPADYLEAARLRRADVEARRAAEPLFARLVRPRPWVHGAGLALLAGLPPLVTAASSLAWPFHPPAALFGLLTVPALLPGAATCVWARVAAATARPFREALAATRPAGGQGPPGCRSCGAPLEAAPDALAATCLYCGTDSLLEALPLGELGAALRGSLTRLRDATGALRRRRAGLALGLAGATVVAAAVSAALVLAVLATV